MTTRGPEGSQPSEPGWWLASDGKWYPPESRSATAPQQAPSQSWTQPAPGPQSGPPSGAWTPAKPKRKKWPIALAIIGVVILIAAIAGAAGGGGGGSKSSATTVSTAAPTASTNTPAPTAQAGPIFTQAGSGTATTASFKVPNNWDFAWTYDCSNFGGQGNFATTNYDLTGAITGNGNGGAIDFDNQGVNQLGARGSGVEHYHSGGNTKYIKVISECAWTITVTKG